MNIGQRIELPVYYNLWMEGIRIGVVQSLGKFKDSGSVYASIKMEHQKIKRLIKVPKTDWSDCKLL